MYMYMYMVVLSLNFFYLLSEHSTSVDDLEKFASDLQAKLVSTVRLHNI